MDINLAIARLDWSKEPKGLYEPIGYALAGGGKRLRPKLCLTACRLFGADEEKALPAALALEIFHNFTLLHDDVMDHAELRHGKECVHRKWDENTAILSGDAMLIEAYSLLAQLPSDKLGKTLQLFNQMATEVCEGQQYDVDNATNDKVTMDDYMEMIRLKTAVLIATSLQIGAYLGDADEEQQNTIYRFGTSLGLAFQIQDDYLDCFGDPTTFGKTIGGDIREGKKTWLYIAAGGAPDNVPEALALYRAKKVDQAALNKIRELSDEALALLDELPQNDETESLRRLVKKLAARKT